MNEINKTLFIPLYGKALVSKQNIILNEFGRKNYLRCTENQSQNG